MDVGLLLTCEKYSRHGQYQRGAKTLPGSTWRGPLLLAHRRHPRQHGGPFMICQCHAGHKDHRLAEQFHSARPKCVALCVAARVDVMFSRTKLRLFASCPRHFTPARPSWPERAFLLLGPRHPAARVSRQDHPWPRRAAFLRGFLPRVRFLKRRNSRRTRGNLNGGGGFCRFGRGSLT